VAPSYALIADTYPAGQRGRALSIYNLGIPLGSAAGVMFGAYVAATVDWRAAFVAVGLAGLAVAPLFRWVVREPERPAAVAGAEPIGRVFAILAAKKSFWLLAFGAASSSMLGYGLAFWLPSLLARSFGLSLPEIGWFYGALLLVGGSAGVLGGGWLGDRLGAKDRGWYARVPAIAFWVAVPLFAAGILSSDWRVALACWVVPQALVYMWLSSVIAAVQHLVPAYMRATASACFLLINNLIGLGAGTLVLGALSDAFAGWAGAEALRYAMLSGLVLYLLAGVLMWLAAPALRRDWVA
jgi:predicted MFS family arabinose efflux permease